MLVGLVRGQDAGEGFVAREEYLELLHTFVVFRLVGIFLLSIYYALRVKPFRTHRDGKLQQVVLRGGYGEATDDGGPGTAYPPVIVAFTLAAGAFLLVAVLLFQCLQLLRQPFGRAVGRYARE